MDHIVYLDAKAKELDLLLAGHKTMIIRGATGRKIPYGRVDAGDVLYFINNNAEGLVLGTAKVSNVILSDKLTEEESARVVTENQVDLQLTKQQFDRWAGKRYLVLIGVADVEKTDPFRIDKRGFGNMDDWLPVEQIEMVTIKE